MPMSVAFAKPGDRGKYATYLKPLVTAEWIRQLTASRPPQLTNTTLTGRNQSTLPDTRTLLIQQSVQNPSLPQHLH